MCKVTRVISGAVALAVFSGVAFDAGAGVGSWGGSMAGGAGGTSSGGARNVPPAPGAAPSAGITYGTGWTSTGRTGPVRIDPGTGKIEPSTELRDGTRAGGAVSPNGTGGPGTAGRGTGTAPDGTLGTEAGNTGTDTGTGSAASGTGTAVEGTDGTAANSTGNRESGPGGYPDGM